MKNRAHKVSKLAVGRRSTLKLACAAALMLTGAVQTAQATEAAYPAKPIRFILPVTGGGTHDAIARAVGQKVSEALGTTVIMENRPGGNGMVSIQATLNAPPDGYTVLISISNILQNLLVNKDPGYDLSDFIALSQIAYYPTAFAVGADVPANTLEEFVELARKSPGKYSYGSYGVGSGAHIIGEGLKKAADINIVHIPYKGETNSYTDLASGRLTANFGSAGFYKRQLSEGKVKVLAVNSPKRLRNFPEIPTFGEAGFDQVNLSGWAGAFIAAGTPPQIAEKLEKAVVAAVASPDVQKVILETGMEPVGSTRARFEKDLVEERRKWSDIIKAIDFSPAN